MDGFFDYFGKLKGYASYPVIFVSAALTVIYTVSLFNFAETEGMADGVKAFAPALFGALFCAFMIYYSCRSIKKALACAVCLLSADAVLYYSSGAHLSFIYCLVLSALFLLVMENSALLYGFLICLAAGVLLSVVFVLLYERYTDFLKIFGGTIKGRGALFGVLSNLFNLFFGAAFDDLFYTKYYSATVTDGKAIITGAVDIFNAFETPQRASAQFLCGKYFETIFIPLGIFASLYKRLEKELLFSFLFSFLLSIVFGDGRLFYLTLLLVSPLIYAGALIIVFIGYTVSSFVDIRTGFSDGAGIIELVKNIQKPVYFILTAALIAVLSYFVSRLIAAKFNILEENRLPKSVLRLVDTLGGEDNIVNIQNGAVIVANPNLIDILRLDCDIHENRVTLLPDDFEKLRKLTD